MIGTNTIDNALDQVRTLLIDWLPEINEAFDRDGGLKLNASIHFDAVRDGVRHYAATSFVLHRVRDKTLPQMSNENQLALFKGESNGNDKSSNVGS